MFLCTSCHDEEHCSTPHLLTSQGKCDVCGEAISCVECRSYKVTPGPPRAPVVRQVLLAPNRALNLRAKAVDSSVPDLDLQKLVVDMIATLRHHEALGLAAPQIDVPLRVIVVRAKSTDEPVVMINPRVTRASPGVRRGEEGCLSMPGKTLTIRRAASINVTFMLPDETTTTLFAEGQLARVIQHEADHLDGILFTQRRS